ncbi:N-acetylneuraminate lyase [Bianquea renquensis]|uniref:N-acetylneuraminate lyase n=1 Tax=Bianquea renquensis TaxID=2763661 RepID=A0A926I2A6_9FIRM|nr:N-acetylneuraminate lyase [Bianquea renquensis]MBC8544293.1 N-acetylneuraminate lyase [Bianquea renquensis]
MKDLHGIFVALVTPFLPDGTVNKPALRKLIRMNLQKGVNGFYCCGSTAEAFMLSHTERKEVLETCAEEIVGKAALIAHIGEISQDGAADLARHAAGLGVDAISSVAPFYYPFTFEEIRSYYYALAESTGLPVILYHFPGYSGVKLSENQLASFLEDPRFIGLKHTSSDFFVLERLHTRFPDRYLFNGYDEMFLSGLVAGATGGIGSTYNLMAEKFIRMYALVQEGRWDEARCIQADVNKVISVLLRVGVIPGIKGLLTLMGIEAGNARAPFHTLSSEEMEQLRAVLPHVQTL